LGRNVRIRVEVVNFARYLNGMIGSIERSDWAYAAVPFDTAIPERVFPDPIRGNDTDPGYDYPAHDVTPSSVPYVMWDGHVALVSAPQPPAGFVRWAEKYLRKI
jgi:hypothetical protein